MVDAVVRPVGRPAVHPVVATAAPAVLDIDDLRLLVVLADELHFGRAAERVHLSQPGLSYRVKRMEDLLGYELFSRVRRNIELTPPGMAVVQGAHRVLSEARRMVDEGERIARGEVATLRVGFVATAVYTLVPRVLRLVRVRHPDLHLIVDELKTAVQVRQLQGGQLDIGLVHLPIAAADLTTVPASVDQVGLALPSDHPLVARRMIDIASLAGEPIVLFPRDLEPDTYDRYVGACVAAGFAPTVAQHASGLQTILGMVASGAGIAFVAGSVARNLSRTGVEFRPLSGAAPVLTSGPAWRHPVAKPAVLLVREAILEVAEQIRAEEEDRPIDQ